MFTSSSTMRKLWLKKESTLRLPRATIASSFCRTSAPCFHVLTQYTASDSSTCHARGRTHTATRGDAAQRQTVAPHAAQPFQTSARKSAGTAVYGTTKITPLTTCIG